MSFTLLAGLPQEQERIERGREQQRQRELQAREVLCNGVQNSDSASAVIRHVGRWVIFVPIQRLRSAFVLSANARCNGSSKFAPN